MAQDYKKTCELYKLAQYNLGYMYELGLGMEQDYIKASELYPELDKEFNRCKLNFENGNKHDLNNFIGQNIYFVRELLLNTLAELYDLRIRAPIEGGQKYKIALERFNKHIHEKNLK